MCLQIAHVNVRSLFANFTQLQDFATNSNYDIIGITETWLHADLNINMLELPDFRFIRHDRVDRRGGGVGFYIHENINFEILFQCCYDFMECMCIKIIFPRVTYVCLNIYRPPNADIKQFFIHFEDILSSLYIAYDNMLCIGDLNIDLLNINSSIFNDLEHIVSTFNLKQIITEPTRITNTNMSLLDPIFCNFENIIESGVIHTNISDHSPVFVKFSLNHDSISSPVSFKYRVLKKINIDNFQRDLESLPWAGVFDVYHIDEKIKFVSDLILLLFDTHAPIKTFRKNKNYKYTPWITDNIKLMIKLRHKALKSFKKSKTPSDYDYYKQL